MSFLNHDSTRQTLLQKVEQLPILERDILSVLAVAAEPLTPSQALALCIKAGIVSTDPAEQNHLTSLAPQLRQLRTLGLIEPNNKINATIIEVMVRRVFTETRTTRTPLPEEPNTPKLPNPLLRELFTKLIDSQKRSTKAPSKQYSDPVPLAKGIVDAVRVLLPAPFPVHYVPKNQLTAACQRFLRELRLCLVGNDDTTRLESCIEIITEHCFPVFASPKDAFFDPMVLIATNPFDPEWMKTLPPDRQVTILARIFYSTLYTLKDDSQALQLALDPDLRQAVPMRQWEEMGFYLIVRLIMAGQLEQAQQLVKTAFLDRDDGYDFGCSGWCALLNQETRHKAPAFFEEALKKIYRRQRKRTIFLNNHVGPLFILSLLRQGDTDALNKAKLYLDRVRQYDSSLTPAYLALNAMLASQCGAMPHAAVASLPLLKPNMIAFTGVLTPLFLAMALFSINSSLTPQEIEVIDQCCRLCRAAGLKWPALEYAHLLCLAGKETPDLRQYMQTETQATGITPLTSTLTIEEPWRKRLRALQMAVEHADGANKKTHGNGQSRIIYLLSFLNEGDSEVLLDIVPLEQKFTAKGAWTKGRPIALQRLMSGDKLTGLSEEDHGLRAAIRRNQSYYAQVTYEFNLDQALPALVGHPRLFLAESPTTPVELIKGEPEVLVVAKGDTIVVRLTPEATEESDRHILIRETPTRYRVVELNQAYHRMAEILGPDGLSLPASAQEVMAPVLASVAALVPVHSTIPGTIHSAESVPADSTPRAHLLPYGDGFRLEFFVKPLGQGGPYLKPGQGAGNLMADVAGRRCQTERNLRKEQKRAATLMRGLPSIAALSEMDDQWFAENVEDALQLLLELREAQARDEVLVEWPEGEKLKLSRTLSFADLSLRLSSAQSWFEVDGEVRVDEERVMDMRQLLDLLATTPHRFLPLGDGEFIALSRELRKRLDEMAAYADRKGKKLNLHPLAALALEEFTEQVGKLDAAPEWHQRLERIREGMAQTPLPPSTFKARLRDYQLEGFQWLARLAHLGFGACLADDMGLGKTIQALAVILHTASQGPTLVVAPTSVCGNWIIEARRFAPTLKLIPFGGTDRSTLLADLGPFDLVIASYGLLHQEAELLTAVNWQTVVLDEAQAIKNAATKRSQAAMHLKANFKLITTGTPIENHLSEFWTLFTFINPGLLGSRDRFNTRFALPIERGHDREAGRRLKKLVRPFILRRLKAQVLEELPPRTEVMLEVEFSPEETAFYEALRQQALERIDAEGGGAGGGKPMRILAEITRLRQACCHPRLIAPESTLTGAKLTLFGEVVAELLENGHKALVFSQFVGHLALIREHLDARNISYRYLDGSTPAKQRQQEVDAFQAGQGDLFLISLKAGGLGLNLTAADYVIHMDPWWNPAVEDQASDRAHRMGQERPVTIYRLVAKNTIEEKIVRLHAEKRDLADSLLDETDTGATLSADELLRLIRES